ncbi:hypothetical protein P9990_27080 (plasmid) [Prescottella equi]|uniref:hypothetical protein n=1 Tax=Rhodococcus hoagii TaxID=43767 RepID=UPI0025773678|nr:hypothetical protein [Prescottella equi]WJJ14706.1 hypothetical protein P9990_27080 [Prescottella equi]
MIPDGGVVAAQHYQPVALGGSRSEIAFALTLAGGSLAAACSGILIAWAVSVAAGYRQRDRVTWPLVGVAVSLLAGVLAIGLFMLCGANLPGTNASLDEFFRKIAIPAVGIAALVAGGIVGACTTDVADRRFGNRR